MSTTTADANAAITQPGGDTGMTGKKRGGAGKVFSAIGIALIIIYLSLIHISEPTRPY